MMKHSSADSHAKSYGFFHPPFENSKSEVTIPYTVYYHPQSSIFDDDNDRRRVVAAGLKDVLLATAQWMRSEGSHFWRLLCV